jgi:hypothetical protein
MHATVHDSGRAYQAGRDMHIVYQQRQSDLAKQLAAMSVPESAQRIAALPDSEAAAVLAAMSTEASARRLVAMDRQRSRRLVGFMDEKLAARLLNALAVDQAGALLTDGGGGVGGFRVQAKRHRPGRAARYRRSGRDQGPAAARVQAATQALGGRANVRVADDAPPVGSRLRNQPTTVPGDDSLGDD